MRGKKEKVLFMLTPGRRHLVVEMDEAYSRRELEVLLKAFRKRLLSGVGGSAGGGRSPGKVDRIVGPGFVIEMLGRSQSRTMAEKEAPGGRR